MAVTWVDLLGAERLTAVVDIGANPIDGDPPYAAMLRAGLCTVTGFEPQESALAELLAAAGPLERYLPHAVGDGGEHELKVTWMNGMTSLFEPDVARLSVLNEFARYGEVLRRTTMATTRLDDVADLGPMDLLKIDIQGSELSVFQNGRQTLSRAVAVHTEVTFVPLYAGQPLFGEVDAELRAQGFVLHTFADLKKWPIAPAVLDGNIFESHQQVIEADVAYVKDFGRLEELDAEQLKHLALLAHHVYGSPDLAVRCLLQLVADGAVDDAGRPRLRRGARTLAGHERGPLRPLKARPAPVVLVAPGPLQVDVVRGLGRDAGRVEVRRRALAATAAVHVPRAAHQQVLAHPDRGDVGQLRAARRPPGRRAGRGRPGSGTGPARPRGGSPRVHARVVEHGERRPAAQPDPAVGPGQQRADATPPPRRRRPRCRRGGRRRRGAPTPGPRRLPAGGGPGDEAGQRQALDVARAPGLVVVGAARRSRGRRARPPRRARAGSPRPRASSGGRTPSPRRRRRGTPPRSRPPPRTGRG